MLDRPRPWWTLASLLPFGWATWIGLLYAAVTARRAVLYAAAAAFLAVTVLTVIATDGGLIIITWIVGLGVSIGLVPVWRRGVRAREAVGPIDESQGRLDARREAHRIAREDPDLAREHGIGRPDLPGAAHAGLVDVNAAPFEVLTRLPGIDDRTATEIARAREELDGFSSLEDLGATLDLPADTVEDLRERVVFLPR